MLLSCEDVFDIVQGCAVLGGGGGGQLSEGLYYAKKALALKVPLYLKSAEETAADTLTCTPILLGACSNPHTGDNGGAPPIVRAMEMVARTVDGNIRAVVPSEAGASNSGLAFYVAAMMEDGFVIDGDYSGRSIPEGSNSKLAMVGMVPSVGGVVNKAGEEFLIQGVADACRLEEIFRSLCTASGNDISVVTWVEKAAEARKAFCEGSMSTALQIGRAVRKGGDVAVRIAETCSGRMLFCGRIIEGAWKDLDGFTVGEYKIAGRGKFDGRNYRVEYKNENMVGWLDGKLSVSIPEIIVLITSDGQVVLNPCEWQSINADVAVVVLPSPPHYLTEEGLQVFGPKYVGLEESFQSAL